MLYWPVDCVVASRLRRRQRREEIIGRLRSGVTRVGVTRGGNWRCHPYFFRKKWRHFFAHQLCSSLSLYWISLGCHSPEGCHPDLVSPLFFVNLATFFIRVSPPGGCTKGVTGHPSSPVTPLRLQAFSGDKEWLVRGLLPTAVTLHRTCECWPDKSLKATQQGPWTTRWIRLYVNNTFIISASLRLQTK